MRIKKILQINLYVILSILLMSSCQSLNKLSYIENSNVKSKKEDTLFQYTSANVNYKIHKNDVLMIRFASTNEEVTKYFEDFSGISQQSNSYSNNNLMGINVNDSGYIEIPIIGKFYAIGYTVEELQNALQVKANKYLINSRILVKLLSFKVTFLGEVGKQGVLQVNENKINLLEALSQVGGITDYGDRKNILIVRKTETGYLTFRVDITKREILEEEQFYLMPNDLIIVESRNYKVLSNNLRDYSTLLATISTIITSITLILSLSK